MAEAQDAGSKKGWGWLRQVRLIPVSDSAPRVRVHAVYGIWNMERSFVSAFRCCVSLCSLHFRQVFCSPRCGRASLLVGSRRPSVEGGYCSLRVGPSPLAPCKWPLGSVVATSYSLSVSFCFAHFFACSRSGAKLCAIEAYRAHGLKCKDRFSIKIGKSKCPYIYDQNGIQHGAEGSSILVVEGIADSCTRRTSRVRTLVCVEDFIWNTSFTTHQTPFESRRIGMLTPTHCPTARMLYDIAAGIHTRKFEHEYVRRCPTLLLIAWKQQRSPVRG